MGDIWTCKIGRSSSRPRGSDAPMREAVADAYRNLTGEEPNFLFSGWGGRLNESERAVADDRLPDPEVVISECHAKIDEALDAMNAAIRHRDEAPALDDKEAGRA